MSIAKVTVQQGMQSNARLYTVTQPNSGFVGAILRFAIKEGRTWQEQEPLVFAAIAAMTGVQDLDELDIQYVGTDPTAPAGPTQRVSAARAPAGNGPGYVHG